MFQLFVSQLNTVHASNLSNRWQQAANIMHQHKQNLDNLHFCKKNGFY